MEVGGARPGTAWCRMAGYLNVFIDGGPYSGSALGRDDVAHAHAGTGDESSVGRKETRMEARKPHVMRDTGSSAGKDPLLPQLRARLVQRIRRRFRQAYLGRHFPR